MKPLLLLLILCFAITPLEVSAQPLKGYKKVEYERRPAPRTLKQRIERLTWGVMREIPPEYDHYGYEIRRLLAFAGSTDVIQSAQIRRQEFQNFQRAREILTAWENDLWKEMFEIDQELKSRGYPKDLTKRYKDHQITLKRFFARTKDWLAAHGLVYRLLMEYEGQYRLDVPNVEFQNQAIGVEFHNRVRQRNEYRNFIRIYPPFQGVAF